MKKNNNKQPLFLPEDYYLTDGGLETTLVFHNAIELPHFAAFKLLSHPGGRDTLLKYYQPYLELAEQYGLHFILETPTWRANTDWGYKLGYSRQDLDEINRKAVHLMRELKHSRTGSSTNFLISGNIGPRGDGYVAKKIMSPSEARAYHQPQVDAFARERADLVTALTLNYSNEAVGIVQAAIGAGISVVISFTVETDGRLPNGETLRYAIEKVDAESNGYPEHFMINCAHPKHFMHVLTEEGKWKNRIRGIRANASIMSHSELDESETLDTGNKGLLADGYADLNTLLPNLRIIGGCCGTDHLHLQVICERIVAQKY